MINRQSIFAKKDLTEAIKLAKDITWFLKQRNLLGPFPSKNGWHVANGICYDCGNLIEGSVYEDRNKAVEVAENIVGRMAMDDIETLQQYGPIGGKCDVCKEKMRLADEIEAYHCRSCGGDCGHCSIYVMLEDCFL